MSTSPDETGTATRSGAFSPDTVDDDLYAASGDSVSVRSNVAADVGDDCPWRTDELYDHECSRYFDCPNHTIERSRDGDAEVENLSPPSPGSVSPVTLHTASDTTEQHDTERRLQDSSLSGNAEGQTQQAEAGQLDNNASSLGGPSPIAPAPPSPDVPNPSTARPVQQSPALDDDYTRQRRSPDSSSVLSSERRAIGNLWRESSGRSLPPVPHESSSEQSPAPLPGPRVSSLRGSGDFPNHDQVTPPSAHPRTRSREQRNSPEVVLPRWQPDAEVTYCPICHSQFNIFVRKHHCRKCGRVVCNSCSPHRIIIPHQYIVRPTGSEIPLSASLLIDGLGGGYFDDSGAPGGERVRLCNPCVPDPNTAPPQSPAAGPASGSPRSPHGRNRNSMGSPHGLVSPSGRLTNLYVPGSSQGSQRNHTYSGSSRNRSVTMGQGLHQAVPSTSSRRANMVQPPVMGRHGIGGGGSGSMPSYPGWLSSSAGEPASSSHQRRLPPTPQIAEEDECPICHNELPSRSFPNFETLRESHINLCIQTHSMYGSPRRGDATTPNATSTAAMPPPPPRRSGMYTYPATEKDCVDDAECTICLEEFTVGVPMARLECLCRFHRSCIAAWFVNHPGRCPVHQHDGFGY